MDYIFILENGKEYLRTGKALSRMIASLPLSKEQMEKLCNAIEQYSDAGRTEAYNQALSDVGVMESAPDCIPC